MKFGRLSLIGAGLAFVAEFATMLVLNALEPWDISLAIAGVIDGVVAAVLTGLAYFVLLGATRWGARASRLADSLIVCVVIFSYGTVLHPLCDRLADTAFDRTALNAIALSIVAGLTVCWIGFLRRRQQMLDTHHSDERFWRVLVVAAAVAACGSAVVPLIAANNTRFNWERQAHGPEILNIAGRQRMFAQRIGRISLLDVPWSRSELRSEIAEAKEEIAGFSPVARAYYDRLTESERKRIPPLEELLVLQAPYLSLAREVSNAPDAARREAAVARLQVAIESFTARMNPIVSEIERIGNARIAEQTGLGGARALVGPLVLVGVSFALLWPILSLVFAQGRLLNKRAEREKNARVALAASELHFRRFTEESSDVTIEIAPDDRITYVSPSCGQFGYEPSDLLGKNQLKLMHVDDIENAVAHNLDLLSTGRVQAKRRGAFRIRAKDGSYAWVENSPSVRLGPDGRPNMVVARLRDVSARKAAEARAAEATGRLSSYQVALDKHAIVAITDLMGNITFANDRFCDVSGYSREELVGQNHRIVNSGMHSREFFADIWRTIERGQSWHGEICNKAKDGHLYWVDTMIVPEQGADGGIEHYVSIRFDITDRVHAKERLAESERRFRGFTTIAADWCWEADADLHFTSVTEGFALLTAQTSGWLLEKRLFDFEDLRTRFARSPSAREAIGARKDFRNHCAMIPAADGGTRYVRLHARAQHDAKGAFTGYLGTATDITDAMQQSQIVEQSERLQSLGTMAAGLAHEFNNVLGIISGHSELAKRALNRGEYDAEQLEPIIEASRRGALLTKSLLSFGRSKTSGVASRVDVATLFVELKLFLKPLIGPGHKIEFDVAEGALFVNVDKDRLIQAMVNLVTNAKDAMPNGGPIAVRARQVEGAGPEGRGGTIELSVADRGVGLSPQELSKIFDPFYTTKDVGQGTGLGLSLVYRFANENDGEVVAQSVLGSGSTFSILLPATKHTAGGANQAGPVSGQAASFDGRSAVVVDDEPALVAVLGTMLRDMGFRVKEFTDPNAALAEIDDEANEIDILVSDVLMPGLDGPALAGLSTALRPDLRVLFVTGQPERMGHDKTEGMEDVTILQKPFSSAELNAALQQVFSRAASAA
jgi:PAS domain S-box-containing protein